MVIIEELFAKASAILLLTIKNVNKIFKDKAYETAMY